jgi:hypothetical protein
MSGCAASKDVAIRAVASVTWYNTAAGDNNTAVEGGGQAVAFRGGGSIPHTSKRVNRFSNLSASTFEALIL